MKIYVVIGTTGEYSDRNEWVVCAYTDEDKAKTHIIKAEEFARVKFLERSSAEDWQAWCTSLRTPLDPQMDMFYTGTSYYYVETDIRAEVPS